MEEILRIKHLSKAYGSNAVLQDINFNLYKGEVIGIMGLHNSGKTVLSHILADEESFSNGSIYFKEELSDVHILNEANKICMIHKHSSLIETLSVMENIFVIRKRRKHLVHKKLMKSQMQYWMKELNINISPSAKVMQLSKIERYIIEIVKAYIFGAAVILIDDLSFENKPSEYQELNHIIETLTKRGVSFIITSYQIKTLQLYSDRIYFLSNGLFVKSIHNEKRNQIDVERILLNNNASISKIKHTYYQPAELLFSSEDIHTEFLKDFTFHICKGEIVVIFDLFNDCNDELWNFLQKQCSNKNCDKFLHEEKSEFSVFAKQRNSIFADFDMGNSILDYLSVSDNLCVGNYNRLSSLGLIKKRRIRYIEKDFSNWYGDDELITRSHCTNLSEKEKTAIYLYRLRLQAGKIIFCKNPEQIADYVTFQLIEQEIRSMANSGTSICIFTSDIDRLRNLADRIILLSEGKLQGEFTYNQLTDYFKGN